MSLLSALNNLVNQRPNSFIRRQNQILMANPRAFRVRRTRHTRLTRNSNNNQTNRQVRKNTSRQRVRLVNISLPENKSILKITNTAKKSSHRVIRYMTRATLFTRASFGFLERNFRPVTQIKHRRNHFPQAKQLLRIIAGVHCSWVVFAPSVEEGRNRGRNQERYHQAQQQQGSAHSLRERRKSPSPTMPQHRPQLLQSKRQTPQQSQ